MREIIIPLNPNSDIDLIQEIHNQLQCLSIQDINIINDSAKIRIKDIKIPFSKVIKNYTIGSMNVEEIVHHSAALLSWLPLLKNERPLIIIHIDKHSDLKMPNLLLSNNHITYDRWTGAIVNPLVLNSVCKAIESTAIEIGSYLTLALYWLPVAGLIWIYPLGINEKDSRINKFCWANTAWTGIDPLNYKICRLQVEFSCRRLESIPTFTLPNGESLDNVLLQLNPCADILLDIDFDYFDNCMENSQALGNNIVHPLEHGILKSRVLELIKNLRKVISSERIINLTLAHSPGFCPEKSAIFLAKIISEILPHG